MLVELRGRNRQISLLYIQPIPGHKRHIQPHFQAKRTGPGRSASPADHILFPGPIPRPFTQNEIVGADAFVLPGGDVGTMLAPFGAVGDDGGGAGETHHPLVGLA
jgi:hypothetical protein